MTPTVRPAATRPGPPLKKALFAAAALLGLAACGRLSDPVVCPAIVPPSVMVTVQDSVTGANVTPGATVELRSGTFVTSVVALEGWGSVPVGGNRTGTFTLTVSQTGYQTWTKTGVEVEEGPCGARTVQLTARLKPAS
jgi:hypothetical protein